MAQSGQELTPLSSTFISPAMGSWCYHTTTLIDPRTRASCAVLASRRSPTATGGIEKLCELYKPPVNRCLDWSMCWINIQLTSQHTNEPFAVMEKIAKTHRVSPYTRDRPRLAPTNRSRLLVCTIPTRTTKALAMSAVEYIRHEIDGVIPDEPGRFRQVCKGWEKEYKGVLSVPNPNLDRITFRQRIQIIAVALYVICFGWILKRKYLTPIERLEFEEHKSK
ncbi:hypothetical protein N7491_008992 [Penicillium cf. griseofulvum]|nr:hypothetical protein N7491_008992 [Penicillium cf. griseofulvum]